MSKRLVDMSVIEIPAEQIAGEKITERTKHDPKVDGHYIGKKSGKTLKCDCGQPRKRGTQLCPKCIKERIAEDEAQHNRRMRQ